MHLLHRSVYARARRSRKLEDVVLEIRRLAAEGTTEVTLLGQTVNSYHDGTSDFADLLRAVGRVDGIHRLRFTSPYPTDFSDRVIAAMAETPAVCEHVHLPAQSGSGRRAAPDAPAVFAGGVPSGRGAPPGREIPGITFSTDLIVGFPGETDGQFEETLSLVADAGFDDAYTFRYSEREGTPAVRLHGTVDEAVARERLERLIDTVREQARARHLSRVGEAHEVLVERPARRGDLMLGRTRTNLLVLLDLPVTPVGEYHRVPLTGTTGSTFTGAPQRVELAVLERAGLVEGEAGAHVGAPGVGRGAGCQRSAAASSTATAASTRLNGGLT